MRDIRFPLLLAASTALLAVAAFGQDVLRDALRNGYTDVAATKAKAEAGDPAAQLSLAYTFASQHRPADALPWFRKAAAQGRIEAVYRIGEMFFSGAIGIPSEKSVKADPATGIQLIFCAATNRYTDAYYVMHVAYRDGVGVPKDIVHAYAWLQLAVDASVFTTASIRRAELNRLALDLNTSSIQEAKQIAALCKAGDWPVLIVLPPAPQTPGPAPATASKHAASAPAANPPTLSPTLDPRIKVNGVTIGNAIRVATINSKVVAEGETITVPLKPKPITLQCIQIETNSVLILLEGEDTPRRLYYRN